MRDFLEIVALIMIVALPTDSGRQQTLYVPAADYRDSLDAVKVDFKAIRDTAAVLYVSDQK